MSEVETGFRVSWKGYYPKKARFVYPRTFATRRLAREFCYLGNAVHNEMRIIHPDGTEEAYEYVSNKRRLLDRLESNRQKQKRHPSGAF